MGGIADAAAPALSMFGDGFSKLASYWWVLFIFVGAAVMILVLVLLKMRKKKNAQWTHKLITRRVLGNNLLSSPVTIKMRRFPLIKRAEVFELETPLLGGYLMPELDQYSGVNEYSIVIDKNNRIYTNKGEFFNPDEKSIFVSAKHSEIDISRSDLRADYQNVNETAKRMEWATIAKYAMVGIAIIAVMIVTIVGFGEWGDSHEAKAAQASAEAAAMLSLAEGMETLDGNRYNTIINY